MPTTSDALAPGRSPARRLAGGTPGAPVAMRRGAAADGEPVILREEAGTEPLEVLRGRVEACAVAAARLAADPGVDRQAALGLLDTAITRLTSARAALLVAEREQGRWQRSGAASFAQWRGQAAGVGSGIAAREERQAHTLTSLPAVAVAAEAGDIALAHVDVITRIASDPSEQVRAAATSLRGQAELVQLARGQDAATFARTAARWAVRHDADAVEDAHQAQRRRRFLHLATTDHGTRLTGLLDNQAGYRLRLALEAANPRPAADDDRSGEQRAADGLTTLAEHILTDPGTQPGAAVRPHVSFLMREQTWTALRRRRQQHARSDEGRQTQEVQEIQKPRSATAHPGVPVPRQVGSAALTAAPVPDTVLMEDGTPVPRSEAEQALCDCELTRVVLDARDSPINLGRTQRLYTGPMRRAVIARDHSCRWPGCARPARWCEIHHIHWWDRDTGDTSLTNAVLLCAHHHHEVHRRDLDVTRISPAPPPRSRQSTPPAAEQRAHLDALGAARYRFVDPHGRLVAGPTWDRTDIAAGSAGAGTSAGAGAGRAATGEPTSAAIPRSSADALRAATPTVEASTLWTDDVGVRTTPTSAYAEPAGRRRPSPRGEPAHRGGQPGRVGSPRSPRAHEATGPAPPR